MVSPSLCLILWISTGSLKYLFCCIKFAKKAALRSLYPSMLSGGIHVFRKLLKLRIRGVNGSISSHDEGNARSSLLVGLCLFTLTSSALHSWCHSLTREITGIHFLYLFSCYESGPYHKSDTSVPKQSILWDTIRRPTCYIRYFNKDHFYDEIPNVPSTSVSLCFPFSIEEQPDFWLEKAPQIDFTGDGHAASWFLELHQLDTFYNSLNSNDQDSLNSAAGGNFLDKMPRECLKIIESKSKVRQSRSKAIVSKVSTSSSTPAVSSDVAELKDMVRALILDKKNQKLSSTPVKAVEQSCVTCGGGHSYQNCPATDGNIYRDNIQEYVSQAAAVNYNQGNASYRPQMVANQIRPPGFPPMQNHQNNQNRGINFNQNRGNNFNQGQVYQPQINQPPTFQAPAYQAPVPPAPGVSKPDFDNYVKANDAVMQNMQNQMANITDLITKFVNSNTASTSGLGSLPSNTIANPKGDVKAITTRSGVSYNGPQISSLPKEMENEPEVTKDTVQPSTENIQPPVVQTDDQIGEPVVASKTKPTLPYPSRANKEKLREKDNLLASKFMEIFRNLHFELSFADALLHMPKFAPMFRKLLNDKDKMIELTKTPVNENCSAVILKKFPEKLGDPGRFLIPCDFPEMNECLALADLGASINLMPLSIWKELIGTFFFPADFVVVDYVADPRVPLILGRPFLRTTRALIDVHGEQMTLRHDDQSVTFKVEYVQEVLEISESGNPTSTSDLMIDSRSPSFTPFGGSDFLMEEIDEFLEHDDSIPPGVDGIYDSEGDTVYLEELFKYLPSHLEYAFLEGDDKLPVIIAKNLKDEDKTALIKFCTHKILMEENAKPVVQHQRRVNPKIHEVIKQEVIKLLDAGLIYPISDSPWVSPVHCVPKKGGITVVKNEENELIPTRSRFVPHDKEKDTFTCPYGTFAYRRMPFGLCNAPGTFQRCMVAIFHDMIEKTMEVFMDDFSVFGDSFSSCLSHLDKSSNGCEDTHLVLNWGEKCPLWSKEGIDAKPRLLRWILLLQEFDVVIRDKKGAENLAADHLSRLENPHQSELEKKELRKTFHLEDIGMVTFRGDDNAHGLRFCHTTMRGHFFRSKECASQQKESFSTDVKHLLLGRPFILRYVPDQVISVVFSGNSVFKREQIYTVAFDYLSEMGEAKRSPPTTPELFENFLNLSSLDSMPLVLL
ncbi:reverse transcriptase domain-containing protein [Tanacetum coccineum]